MCIKSKKYQKMFAKCILKTKKKKKKKKKMIIIKNMLAVILDGAFAFSKLYFYKLIY